MPLWKTTDLVGSKPRNTIAKPRFANNSTVFGVSKAEAKVAGNGVSAGWVRVTLGTGFVRFSIGAPGTGYANTDTIVVSSTNPSVVNATANVLTSAAGGNIIGFTNVKNGSGYINNTSVAITTVGGLGGSVIATLGGRAGRKTVENLTSTKITGDNVADNIYFPGT